MSFTPVVPLTGYAGWTFLTRTIDSQKNAFEGSAAVTQSVEYFAENIDDITSAEDLVNDRRLLEVALGAFGLGEDINNKFFIQKILEEGTSSDDALANRLADKRYAAFADAFGFADGDIPATQDPQFAAEVADLYTEKQFEIAVGDQNSDFRIALNAQRELTELADRNISDSAKWFTMMGNPPLRDLFETALALPSEVSQLDLDKQLEIFREKSERRFGTDKISDFADPETQEDLIRLFIVQSEMQAAQTSTSSGAIALTLLQGVS